MNKSCPFKFAAFIAPKPQDPSKIITKNTIQEIVQANVVCPCDPENCMAGYKNGSGLWTCSLIAASQELLKVKV